MFRDKLTTAIDKLLILIPYLSIAAVAITTIYLFIVGKYAILTIASAILVSVVIVSLLLIINRKNIQQNIRLGTEKKISAKYITKPSEKDISNYLLYCSYYCSSHAGIDSAPNLL